MSCRLASITRVLLAVVVFLSAVVFVVPSLAAAAPTQDRALHGYPDVATNGFGATNSWAGSLGLYTGPNQTGEFIEAYCIQRGLDYPRGTDPDFADANSGFAVIGDIPAQRGVSAADRQAIAYSLWRYGDSTDDLTAAAMFLLTHLQSGDDEFGSTTLESTVLGADWPNPAAVMARAKAIRDESMAQRGPWTMTIDVTPAAGSTMRVTASLRGPGGPIRDVDLVLATTNADGDATVRTDANGQVVRTVTATDPALPVGATATRTRTPAYYRVFQGRANTQQLITSGGDGAPVTATDQASVPRGTIRVIKTTTNPAYQSGAGAVFEVRAGDATGAVAATLTVGADGTASSDPLVPGRYVLVETLAPAGQQLDPTPTTVEVAAGQTVVIERVNRTLDVGALRLVKTDGETGEVLAGAAFTVAFDADANGTYETPIGTEPWATTADAAAPITISGLAVGNYQVVEVRPPTGYTRPEPDVATQVVVVTIAEPTVTVGVENRRPRLATQVVSTAGAAVTMAGVGTEVADQVRIDNVAAATTATVTARLYGPFPTDADIVCSEETLAGVQTFATTGSGVFTSPRFPLAEPGIYTFVESAEFDDGSSATHACGEASETVAVPAITTSVSAADITIGDAVVDVAHVTGVRDGVVGQIDAVAYGPFESVDAIVCNADTEVFRTSYEVAGSGTFPSPEFEPAHAGIYTFVERWTAVADATISATHPCGETAETVVVRPVVQTQISLPSAFAGESVLDTAVIVGAPDTLAGTVRYELFGPIAAGEEPVCDDASRVADSSAATAGAAPVESAAVPLDQPGRYTFVASWTSASGEITASHACGLAAETTTVSPPGATTVLRGPAPAVRAPRPTATALAKTGSTTLPMTVAGGVAVVLGASFIAWVALDERRRFRSYWSTVRGMSQP